MNIRNVFQIAIICFLMIIQLPLVHPNSNSTKLLKRGKRYLDFLAKSRMFFRANVKDNVIKVNTLWAHAYGYRANYAIENDKKYRPFRRDVYETVEELVNRHGFDGQACALMAFCTAAKMIQTDAGMLFKLFKMIFTLEEHDNALFPYLKEENCGTFERKCPLTLESISPYTDDI